MSPADYPPADHMQQIAKVSYDEALRHGLPGNYMTLLPCGIYPERFACAHSRAQLREEHGIAEDVFVILCVAALNRNHKRVDYLIEEVSRVEGKCLLWLDGSLDHGDPGLVDFARERLGERCRITHVASNEVAELYHLADIQVHCSLFEAFGLSIVEGAATGLPLLTHNAPHFQWLLPNPDSWIDMERPGALSARLSFLMSHPEALEALTCAGQVSERFAWENLKHEYLALYRRVAEGPLSKGRRQ